MEGLKYCVLFRKSSEFMANVPPHTSNDLINIGFLVLFYKMFGYNYSEKIYFFFSVAALKDPFLL